MGRMNEKQKQQEGLLKSFLSLENDMSSLRPYVVMADTLDDMNNRFSYHPPHGTQTDRYIALRDKAHEFAKQVLQMTPQSREQSLALTKLEEAVMWANASIARNEPPTGE